MNLRIWIHRTLRLPRMAVAIVATAALVAGCAKPASELIVIRGSNTVGEELVPRLAAEFKRDRPAVAFDLEFKGSSFGLGALMSGQCDIGASSRELSKVEPVLAKERGVEFQDHVIGSYSVAVVVHAANPVGNLTREQVRDIFTGTIQNWKDVGGPDAPITLFIRDQISGTHLGFQDLAMDHRPYAATAKALTNYAEIVRWVGRDEHGIGYASLDLTTKPRVKPLSIAGVDPTAATVNSGKYPFARVLHLFTDKLKPNPVAEIFVEFVRSEHGQKVVAEMGYLPKP